MSKKIHPNIQLLAVSAIAWFAFGGLLYFVVGSGTFVSNQVEAAVPSTPIIVPMPAAQKTTGVPMRVKIPSIGVNAAVESVTLAADGSMDVPKDPNGVAWYAPGPQPGEQGSAVLAGHVNWYHGAAGSFAHLRDVSLGDIITIQDDVGKTTTFVVRKTRTYAAAAQATDVFSSTDGKAHLNLVTCSGVWDKVAKQYTKRLVVFADKE